MADVLRPRSDVPLVARDRELAQLRAALGRAGSGTPGAVLVSGDAGVGKSRLLDELLDTARAEGATVLTGRCVDMGESALPYLPFAEAFAGLAAGRADLIRRRPALVRLMPSLFADATVPGSSGSPTERRADRPGQPNQPNQPDQRDQQGRPGRQPGQVSDQPTEQLWSSHPGGLPAGGGALAGVDQDTARLQLFDAVSGVLAELAADQTVVLALEDVHWADAGSRDLLAFLFSRLYAQRVLIVATYRSDDLHRRHPLRAALAEWVRLPAVARIDLAPLTKEQTSQFVRTLTDELPDPVVRTIVQRSEGNAFFAEELVAAAEEGGGERLPSALADVLLARLERLPPAALRVVRAASAAGRRVRSDMLAAVVDLPEDELEQALYDSVRRNVLRPVEGVPVARDGSGLPRAGVRSGTANAVDGSARRPDGIGPLGSAAGAATPGSPPGSIGGGYVFRHALLAEAAYLDLLPGERVRLHAAYARVLADMPDRPGVAGELAYHSRLSNDLPRALVASIRAADEAERVGAPREAIHRLTQALELWPAVADAADQTGTTELGLLVRIRDLAAGSGDFERAIAYARSVVEAVDVAGTAEDRARERVTLARCMMAVDGLEQEGNQLLVEAGELLRDEPLSTTTALALSGRAIFSKALGAPRDEVRRLTEQALEVATTIGSAEAEADTLVTLARLQRADGETEHAIAQLKRAIDRAAEAGGTSDSELRAIFNLGMVDVERGEVERGVELFRHGLLRARQIGRELSGFGIFLRIQTALGLTMTGDWDAVLELTEVPVESAPPVRSMLNAARLGVLVRRGRFEVAEAIIGRLRAERFPDLLIDLLVGLGGAEMATFQGRPERAIEYVDETLQRYADFDDARHASGIRLAALGIGAAADVAQEARRRRGADGGAIETGQRLLRHAREVAEAHQDSRAPMGPEGLAWLALVEAEATRLTRPASGGIGDAGDVERWREAVEAFGYGDGYPQACARVRLAAALLAEGARDDAAVELRSALDTATALEATPLRDAIVALAGRARIDLGRVDSLAGSSAGSGASAGGSSATGLGTGLGAGVGAGVGPGVAAGTGVGARAGSAAAASSPSGGRAARSRTPGQPPGARSPRGRASSVDVLTPRETAILREVADGRTNRQIGERLFISDKTVSVHLSRAMAKLGVGSRAEAVSVAYERGLLTPAAAADPADPAGPADPTGAAPA